MKSSHFRGLLAEVAALVALIALMPSTAAATTTPAPGYAQFTGCPHPGENPSIETCFHTVFTSGELQMGNVEIPIEEPITMSGGITTGGTVVFGPFGGLEPVDQSVPGGIVGLTGLTWLGGVLSAPEQEVQATIELAGVPSSPVGETLLLPIKVHLTNTVLGPNCYIGSNANPIVLDLTIGTTSPPPPNSPITGAEPEVSFTPNSVVDFTDGTYVDNAFAAPGVNGCTLVIPPFPPIGINGVINSQSELPSPAGSNQAILTFDSEFASSEETVYP
jgi:hypothetical protein